MNYSLSELDDRTIIYLKIDGMCSLSPTLIDEINKACDSAEDAEHSAIIFIYLGGKQNQEDAYQLWPGNVNMRLVSQWEKVLSRLERLAAITLTVMDYICGGVALEILLTTDYRIVTHDLRIELLGSFKEIWPGMLIHRLANQLGVTRSRSLMLFSAEITGPKIAELGLANEVVTDVSAALKTFSHTLKSTNTADIAIRRRLLLEASATSFDDALGTHLAACDRVLRRHVKISEQTVQNLDESSKNYGT